MSSYVVLARKWRPSQFSDVVGQSHIVHTLNNAIGSDRLHQAYLFAGSSGIGKTTIARIFAKVVRCPERKFENQELKSCDQCSSCKEIASGKGVDVIEIDGASNNGVDAVREIRENAKFLPSSGQKKIYIIDEVHMLTTAAFNALLKTLEEPPAHVIFIFATTEPHKIPATILARCQRFDFRRVTPGQVLQRLEFVSSQENVTCEPGALNLIAGAAEGSMRDALTLLDQVIAYAGNQISQQSTREAIGLIESQTLTGILQSILKRDASPALKLVEEAYNNGHDLRVLTQGLIETLHQIILAKVGYAESLRELASLRELEELEVIFQVFHYGMDWIARSPQPKMVLDILVIKCACAETLIQVSDASSPSSGVSNQKAHTASTQKVNPVSLSPTPTSVDAPRASTLSLNSQSLSSRPQKPTSTSPETQAQAPKNWEGLVAHTRQNRPFIASLLEHASDGVLSDSELTISFHPSNSFKREQLQAPSSLKVLQELADSYFNRPLRILTEMNEGAGESLAQKRYKETQAHEDAIRQSVIDHPVIREAKSLFNAELGPIELTLNGDKNESQSSSHA